MRSFAALESELLRACRSTSDQLLQVLGITRSLNRNFRGRAFEFAQVFGRELNRRRPGVLLQAMQLRRAGDGNNPRLLRQQPGQRDLRGRDLLPRRELSDHLHERLVRLGADVTNCSVITRPKPLRTPVMSHVRWCDIEFSCNCACCYFPTSGPSKK